VQAHDEAKELAAEYALLRKVKSGRMSEHAYEVATGLTAASGSDSDESPATSSMENAEGSKKEAAARKPEQSTSAEGKLQLKQKAREKKMKRKKSKKGKHKSFIVPNS